MKTRTKMMVKQRGKWHRTTTNQWYCKSMCIWHTLSAGAWCIKIATCALPLRIRFSAAVLVTVLVSASNHIVPALLTCSFVFACTVCCVCVGARSCMHMHTCAKYMPVIIKAFCMVGNGLLVGTLWSYTVISASQPSLHASSDPLNQWNVEH